MESSEKQMLQKVANTVRALAADAIEQANSGHPGLPLGAADLGAYLFAKVLHHNPKNPKWIGRDRFILSAGHGSTFLYSLLHLSGYDLPLDQLKKFRTLHSMTPGHPEYGETPGVETTSGPLGQGIACGTGIAIGQKLLAARLGEELFDAKVWILAGDGCLMEGISSEASSLAGTLGLNNLVLMYDSNGICLDGPTSECFTEDTARRYEAYGWRVMEIDGYDFDQMETAFAAARAEQERPTLIVVKTIIAKGVPGKEGTAALHGAKLGPDLPVLKRTIGWPEEMFFVPAEVSDYFVGLQPTFAGYEAEWNKKLEAMKCSDSKKAQLWQVFVDQSLPKDFEQQIWDLQLAPNQATRRYSEAVVNKIADLLPFFVTGSADLSSCDFTWIKGGGIVGPGDWNHQQIKFGVREFAMGACAYGITLTGMIQPAVGTFLTFSDYMKNAVRIAAIMKQRVIFVYSHDSVWLGEDGPTHQPAEHLMSLRLIPNLTLIRPGDENESKAAWIAAFEVKNGPVALCFTRNPVASKANSLTAAKAQEGVKRGAYVLYGKEGKGADVLIIATGSEIQFAFGAAQLLEAEGKSVRLVSMPSWEIFEAQDEAYKRSVLGGQFDLKVSVEAGCSLGWQKYIGQEGLSIAMDTFGASAHADVLVKHFGFAPETIAERILAALKVPQLV